MRFLFNSIHPVAVLLIFTLAACSQAVMPPATSLSQTAPVSPTPVLPETVSTPSKMPLTATANPTASSSDEFAPRISAIIPVTIYIAPNTESSQAGMLEAGANARLLGTREGGWMNIECPDTVTGSCWILWDMNTLYSYEGPAIALTIPEPASLNIESTNRATSPDGRWQAVVTQTETVALDGEFAFFFFTELTVTSHEDGITWTPVSEWHAYGIGHEFAPTPFHWSNDGHYFYYTSLFDMHGGCGSSMNIGESFDRLDLVDGTVTSLPPPQAFRLLSISPDETRIAYLSGPSMSNFTAAPHLVVRDLETAYTAGAAGKDSVLWQIPLEIEWPASVSEIAWGSDSSRLLVTATTPADVICNLASSTTWELDMATGELVEVSNIVFPTPTP